MYHDGLVVFVVLLVMSSVNSDSGTTVCDIFTPSNGTTSIRIQNVVDINADNGAPLLFTYKDVNYYGCAIRTTAVVECEPGSLIQGGSEVIYVLLLDANTTIRNCKSSGITIFVNNSMVNVVIEKTVIDGAFRRIANILVRGALSVVIRDSKIINGRTALTQLKPGGGCIGVIAVYKYILFENTIFRNCVSNAQGGCVSITGGALEEYDSISGEPVVKVIKVLPDVTFRNLTVEDCTSSATLGGCVALSFLGNVILDSVSLNDCECQKQGGCIRMFNVTTLNITKLRATNCNSVGAAAGGLSLGNITLGELDDLTFINTTAMSGGAFRGEACFNMRITNVYISNATSRVAYDGVVLFRNPGNVSVRGLTIQKSNGVIVCTGYASCSFEDVYITDAQESILAKDIVDFILRNLTFYSSPRRLAAEPVINVSMVARTSIVERIFIDCNNERGGGLGGLNAQHVESLQITDFTALRCFSSTWDAVNVPAAGGIYTMDLIYLKMSNVFVSVGGLDIAMYLTGIVDAEISDVNAVHTGVGDAPTMKVLLREFGGKGSFRNIRLYNSKRKQKYQTHYMGRWLAFPSQQKVIEDKDFLYPISRTPTTSVPFFFETNTSNRLTTTSVSSIQQASAALSLIATIIGGGTIAGQSTAGMQLLAAAATRDCSASPSEDEDGGEVARSILTHPTQVYINAYGRFVRLHAGLIVVNAVIEFSVPVAVVIWLYYKTKRVMKKKSNDKSLLLEKATSSSFLELLASQNQPSKSMSWLSYWSDTVFVSSCYLCQRTTVSKVFLPLIGCAIFGTVPLWFSMFVGICYFIRGGVIHDGKTPLLQCLGGAEYNASKLRPGRWGAALIVAPASTAALGIILTTPYTTEPECQRLSISAMIVHILVAVTYGICRPFIHPSDNVIVVVLSSLAAVSIGLVLFGAPPVVGGVVVLVVCCVNVVVTVWKRGLWLRNKWIKRRDKGMMKQNKNQPNKLVENEGL